MMVVVDLSSYTFVCNCTLKNVPFDSRHLLHCMKLAMEGMCCLLGSSLCCLDKLVTYSLYAS